MTTTWLELRHPLEPHFVELLGDLDDVLRGQGIPYLLSGAMAREILLHYGHGCTRGRETSDMDFGVTVADWKAYKALRESLVASGRFRLDPKEAQRVIHTHTRTGLETRVDLVPFGAIAGADGTIAWPPDGAHVMHVLGYEQAMACSIRLKIDGMRGVPMASAVGLAIMKLVAYEDRAARTQGRDAADLFELLRHHAETLSDAQLYDADPEAMERYEFRPEPAGAWILGRRVSEQLDDQLRGWMRNILRPESRSKMLNHMIRGHHALESETREAEVNLLLEAFQQGLGITDGLLVPPLQ